MTATITAVFEGARCVTENSAEAQGLFSKNRYGTLRPDGRLELGGYEALFLAETGRIIVLDGRGRQVSLKTLRARIIGRSADEDARYAVFADMRRRGYTVKTALKFGADFRVYGRGAVPGKDHAKWVLFAVREHDKLTWHSFAAKSRVAHSTKKDLLIGAVDDEGDITYWQVGWLRP